MALIKPAANVAGISGRTGGNQFGNSTGGITVRTVVGALSNSNYLMLLRDGIMSLVTKTWAAEKAAIIGSQNLFKNVSRNGWARAVSGRMFWTQEFRYRQERRFGRNQQRWGPAAALEYAGYCTLAMGALHAGWPYIFGNGGAGQPIVPTDPPPPRRHPQLTSFTTSRHLIDGRPNIFATWTTPDRVNTLPDGVGLVILASRILTNPRPQRKSAMKQIRVLNYASSGPENITENYIDNHGTIYATPPQYIKFRAALYDGTTLTFGNSIEHIQTF